MIIPIVNFESHTDTQKGLQLTKHGNEPGVDLLGDPGGILTWTGLATGNSLFVDGSLRVRIVLGGSGVYDPSCLYREAKFSL